MTPSLGDLVRDWIKDEGIEVGCNEYGTLRRRDSKLMGIVYEDYMICFKLGTGFYIIEAIDPQFFNKLRVHLTTF